MVRAWISKIKINDGTEVQLDKNDIVVFVGPNNAGKSASLKEINHRLDNNVGAGPIITYIDIEREGDVSELIHSLERFSKNDTHNRNVPMYHVGNSSFDQQSVRGFWNQQKNGLHVLRNFFVNSISTENRLSAANPPQNIPKTTQLPQHPIHFLQFDDSLENRFSNYFKQAFGSDLIVHHNAGNTVPLYVGEKPNIEPGEDRVSIGYLKKLERLPVLHSQGDGMRSFVGVLLHTFTSSCSIHLIDEPEAFLHPPQARLLGKMLSKDLPTDRQLFLSTHSEDFLKGLLDSGNQNIKVIRIRREGSINRAHQLDKTDINEIWQDSLLRHSNILSGLFHSKVVICEGDSDCRFYSAVLYALFDGTSDVSPDILFTHCGGKGKEPTVIKALKKLDVPIQVISDFDILNNKSPIKEIITELKGNWDDFEKDWNIIKSEIDKKSLS
ncbi:MAG: ATP-binding protein [Chlorobiales bacterium]|jgi:hypothetical protein|nr:ATP-binding protein [Chlorobiales bacterium]